MFENIRQAVHDRLKQHDRRLVGGQGALARHLPGHHVKRAETGETDGQDPLMHQHEPHGGDEKIIRRLAHQRRGKINGVILHEQARGTLDLVKLGAGGNPLARHLRGQGLLIRRGIEQIQPRGACRVLRYGHTSGRSPGAVR